jgi:hypothetical protein
MAVVEDEIVDGEGLHRLDLGSAQSCFVFAVAGDVHLLLEIEIGWCYIAERVEDSLLLCAELAVVLPCGMKLEVWDLEKRSFADDTCTERDVAHSE